MASSSPGAWSVDRVVAVAAGAAVGALLRVLVGRWLPTDPGTLPTATLLINLSGCLVIGLLTPTLRRAPAVVGTTLTTGLLGGYTTFGTFCLDVQQLTRAAPATMLAYLALTVVGCVLAAAAGLVVGERLVPGRGPARPARDASAGPR